MSDSLKNERFTLAALAGGLLILALASCHANLDAYRDLRRPDVSSADTKTLVRLIAGKESPLNLDDGATEEIREAISKELIRRKAVRDISKAYGKSDYLLSYELYAMLEEIGGPEAERTFRRNATHKRTTAAYLALMRFAEKGEEWALAILNENYFEYPVSSYDWAEAVELFGKYKYIPAAKNLVDTVNAASLNLAGASHEALCELFPKAAQSAGDFSGGPAEAEEYWKGVVERRHGF